LDTAAELRRRTLDVVAAQGDIYEYYNPETGQPPPRAANIFGWTSAVFIDLAIQAHQDNGKEKHKGMINPEVVNHALEASEAQPIDRSIMVVSNRGPVSLLHDEDGSLQIQRSGGGLVTALTGLAQTVEMTWVAAALNELENAWEYGPISLGEGAQSLNLQFVPLAKEVYEGYYNVISNPLLWFGLLEFHLAPNITRATRMLSGIRRPTALCHRVYNA
jgi:hypothetical protein